MKKWNKFLCITAVSIFVFSMMISGEAFAEKRIRVGSNRLGTSNYVQGATVADIITKYAGDIVAEAVPLAGSVGNVKLIEKNDKMELALPLNVDCAAAIQGISGFQKSLNIRCLMGNMDRYYAGVMARGDLPYKTWEELLKAKAAVRLYTQAKGAGAELLASRLLECGGASYDDIKKWGGSVEFTDTENIINAFKDGRCDIFVLYVNKGHPVVSEIALSGKMRFLELSPEQQKVLEAKYSLVPDKLPAGVFKNQELAVSTVMASTIAIVHSSMDDETAYKITKAIMGHKEDMIKGHKSFNDFDLKKAASPEFLGGVPLHPGAVQYFKEIGQVK